MKEMFSSPRAPRPTNGRIAQVSIDKDIGIAYISGLVSQKPDGTVVYNTSIAEQTKLIMDHLKAIVEDMGLTMDHVIKTNLFITNWDDFDDMCAVYDTYFSAENPPARQCVQSNIWGNLGLEISAVVTLK